MTQPRWHQLIRGRRVRALIAGFALVMLVLGLSGVRSTTAAWTDKDEATGSFSAGSLKIRDLTCTDNSGLLGLGGDQLKLDWKRPQISDSVQLAYTVTVIRTPLLSSPSTTTYTTEETTLTYRDTKLSLLSIPTYTLTVQAKPIGEWSGSAATVKGHGINLATLGLVLRCNS
ncbi:SipW-cognate class signal peptide [Brevibacterium sp. 239c]|nr:SipW-cognate class signal peptide [Brevibacterium sp. 239c]